jgi:hypothetical protein
MALSQPDEEGAMATAREAKTEALRRLRDHRGAGA